MAAPQTKNLQQTKTPQKTMRRTTRMITTLAPKVDVTTDAERSAQQHITDRTNATSKPEDSDDQHTLAPKDVDAKTQRQTLAPKVNVTQPDTAPAAPAAPRSEQQPNANAHGTSKIYQSEIHDTRSRIDQLGIIPGNITTADRDLIARLAARYTDQRYNGASRVPAIQPRLANQHAFHNLAQPVFHHLLANPALATIAGFQFDGSRAVFGGDGGSVMHHLQFLHSPTGHRAVQQLIALLDSKPGITDAELLEVLYQAVDTTLIAGDGPRAMAPCWPPSSYWILQWVHYSRHMRCSKPRPYAWSTSS
jgi:hypothetical protein